MVLMTMIARVADGLPLAASVQEEEQVCFRMLAESGCTKRRMGAHWSAWARIKAHGRARRRMGAQSRTVYDWLIDWMSDSLL